MWAGGGEAHMHITLQGHVLRTQVPVERLDVLHLGPQPRRGLGVDRGVAAVPGAQLAPQAAVEGLGLLQLRDEAVDSRLQQLRRRRVGLAANPRQLVLQHPARRAHGQ